MGTAGKVLDWNTEKERQRERERERERDIQYGRRERRERDRIKKTTRTRDDCYKGRKKEIEIARVYRTMANREFLIIK